MVTIIAEAGVNHNGDIGLAKKLIQKAAIAGADYVKFQTFKTDQLVNPEAKKAAYQKKNMKDGDIFQFNMLKKLEISMDDHHLLIEHCFKNNIRFLSTAFDLVSIDTLKALELDFWKIPSGEITNKLYLRKIGAFNQKVVISTGMSEMNEIEQALKVLIQSGTKIDNITILHCNTEYPTPMQDVNLRAMHHIRNTLKVNVGYSDHTLGIEVPIAAVAMGASVIEKHITLDKTMQGPDHASSLEPNELCQMVTAIRNIEQAMGNNKKEVSPSEIRNRTVVRKSLHLNRNMNIKDVLQESDFIALRPATGISPMDIEQVIGKRLKVEKKAYTPLNYDELTI